MSSEIQDTMIKDGMLNLMDDVSNFHIESVEVFTGPDDGYETDCIKVTAAKSETFGDHASLSLSRRQQNQNSNYRIRHEPCVRLFLKSECDYNFCLSITHHKGKIMFDVEQLEDTPYFRPIELN